MRDAARKKRLRPNPKFGVNHYKTILTTEQVREILDSTETCAALGRRFGVDRTTVSHIRNGKNWVKALGETIIV